MSTAHSSFDQYCISHKTISHRAAAAPSPEARRECPDDIISSFAPPRNKSWRRHCGSSQWTWHRRFSSRADDVAPHTSCYISLHFSTVFSSLACDVTTKRYCIFRLMCCLTLFRSFRSCFLLLSYIKLYVCLGASHAFKLQSLCCTR